MIVNINRIDDLYKLEATNESGEVLYMDGSKSLGAGETAFRPMQTLLASLAGCSAIDVISILKKGRQRIDDFKMRMTGEREPGAVPAPFTAINVHFILTGKIKPEKIEKAMELAQTKYCSVYFSLHPNIDITYTYELTAVE